MLGLLFYIGSFLIFTFVIVKKFDLTYIMPIVTGIAQVLTILAGLIVFKEHIGTFGIIRNSLSTLRNSIFKHKIGGESVTMKKIYAILPCYNEEKNIDKLIEEWKEEEEKLEKEGYNLEIVAIDDKSTDNTKEEILKKVKKYENVKIIEHEKNKGLCGGINSGISYFSKKAKEEDLFVLMDGDNTHEPKYIHEMIEKISVGNTCVIASRYEEGSSITGLSKRKRINEQICKNLL